METLARNGLELPISLHKVPQFHQKLCENCAVQQNFHTRKLGEITVFYAVSVKYRKVEPHI